MLRRILHLVCGTLVELSSCVLRKLLLIMITLLLAIHFILLLHHLFVLLACPYFHMILSLAHLQKRIVWRYSVSPIGKQRLSLFIGIHGISLRHAAQKGNLLFNCIRIIDTLSWYIGVIIRAQAQTVGTVILALFLITRDGLGLAILVWVTWWIIYQILLLLIQLLILLLHLHHLLVVHLL